jgi:hypothetical protein
VPQIDEAFEMRQKKPPEHGIAHQGASFAAKVVPMKKYRYIGGFSKMQAGPKQ